MPNFHGVVPPVVTPLNREFQVDYPSYTRVLENLIDGGVHGLFVLGSTSEVVFHDDATGAGNPRARGQGGQWPRAGLRRRHRPDHRPRHRPCARSPSRPAPMPWSSRRRSTPAPASPRSSTISATSATRSTCRLIAYDIPVCVHAKLERKTTVTTLAREGTIAGLKDSSGDDGNFRYVLLDLADTAGLLPA